MPHRASQSSSPMMQAHRLRRRWLAAAALALAALAATALVRYLMRPVARALSLPDGTQVYFYSDSRFRPDVHYPQRREIAVDGDFFFRSSPVSQPLIVRSRLLVLTVSGPSAFRITAHAAQTGEQVEVLSGNIVARKNYPSTYEEPDVLAGGQMTMINRTIDLMEKENFDPSELRSWSSALIAAATAAR